ncbi:MAG: WbqC family protein [Thermoplasmata archaeon]|nr:MAG: WbqC family protein [Thermoplasmata archaeon]
MNKVIAIHQPNYIPWLGYFHKIYHSDLFVFLDSVQYPKGQLVNKNRIKTANGELYLTVPVLTKNRFGQNINEVRIDNHINWRKKHWKSMLLNYKNALFFQEYSQFFEALYERDWDQLADLNIYLIENITKILGIKCEFAKSSDLEVSGDGTELLINICKAVGANTYLSGIGSKGYMKDTEFAENAVNLRYQEFNHPQYKQQFGEFITNLSIVDLLFNEGPNSKKIIVGDEI